MSTPSTVVRSSHVRVHDVDAAQQLAASLYGNVIVSYPRRTTRLCWRLKSHSIGSVTLIAARQDQDGQMRTEALASHYVLASLRQGVMEISAMRQTVPVVPREHAALLNPDTEAKAVWRAGMASLNVLLAPQVLRAHLSALTGTEIQEAPRFELPLDLRSGPAADVRRIAHLLHDTCSRTDGAPASPHVLAHLREALCGALLFAAESTVSHLVHRTSPPACRRAVRLVEEYLTAHASEPISLTDLAAVTGVALRSLQRSFRAAHGMSPRAFLTTARLELARRHLLAAQPGTTVTQVLHASGFGHPGEFSAAYRRRFGERPSATLRRAVGAPRALPALAQGP